MIQLDMRCTVRPQIQWSKPQLHSMHTLRPRCQQKTHRQADVSCWNTSISVFRLDALYRHPALLRDHVRERRAAVQKLHRQHQQHAGQLRPPH